MHRPIAPLCWREKFESAKGKHDRGYRATCGITGDKYRVMYCRSMDRWLCFRNGQRAAVPPLLTSREGRTFCDGIRVALAAVVRGDNAPT